MKAKGTGRAGRAASGAAAGAQEEPGAPLERAGPSPFPVVGVGASAGGLEAFRLLLGELPHATGMAFVLVQHLAPQHESKLAELLSKDCALPVTEAIEGEVVRPDHVYVIPPNADLALSGGRLRLTARTERAPHLPVDLLFRSLADKQGGSAIGVVLSGTGSDGTLGLCEIKAAGGITFAQEGQSAGHAGMPSSAVESGCVDFVLPPAEIARRLVEIGRHSYLTSARSPQAEGAEDVDREAQEGLRRVLAAVRAVRGVDFGQYRDSTIRRRIARRMALHGEESLNAYAERLEADRGEVEALYHDLLINVTSFFRDPEMFEVLKRIVFPAIVKDKQPGEPLRIWVPGCSSGQEAYSLAMALQEYLDTQPARPTIHIFGTDLSDQAVLEKARTGFYPDSIEAEVSPERLRRFFTKEGARYRIDRSIRELCVFARQNVAVDPPFSHLDLISCRNLLIYLAPSLHKRVLPTFHYALDVPGFLVLGPAETAGGNGELFELVDRTHKIYTKKPVDQRPALHFATEGLRIPAELLGRRRAAAMPITSDFQREADRLLLGRFAPPAVLVNQSLDVVQFRGRTSAYLEAPPGEPTVGVLSLAREGLFLELRSALAEVARTGHAALRQNVRLMSEGATREITLEVLPVKPSQTEGQCLLIVFHEKPRDQPAAADPGVAASDAESTELRDAAFASRRELESLRQELVGTKEYLESMAEQQDAANEELRSANAEILSTNEELQSTNEELETAKEELQSANEELTTVNEQLQHRNLELSQVNNDLTNLLSSTEIPVVMVGGDLRIRRVTGPARRVMSVLPTDVGRPIGDIRTAVDLQDPEALIRDVIEREQPVQRSVRDRQGRWYELRVMPYRTADDRVEGAVIALVDVDQIRRNQEELLQQALLLRQQAALLELSHDAVIVRDAADVIQFWNHGAEEMYGYSGDEARGLKLDALLHTDPELWSVVKSTLESAGSWEGELRQVRSDGAEIIVHSREVLVRDGDGAPATILAIKRDVTENKRVLHELKHADRRKDKFLATLAHGLRNPIAPIRNAVEIMRLAGNDAAVIENVREMLDRQVRQLAGIVDDLIDISRIVEKKIALHLERVPIEAIVDTAVDTARSAIEGAKHELTLTLPSEPLLMDADPVRLSQVLVNLLNNAAKFTPPGGRIWLTVEAAPATSPRKRAEVVIRVRDTGVGIAPDQRARIFEMFEQGGGQPQGNSGLGVGLSLARSLVDMHGGTIEVVSAGPGLGTEFILRLPAADPRSPGPAHGARLRFAEGSAEARRILVVDDNRDQAQSMGKLLELMGHAVRLAYDGEEALRVARDFLPDVALVDVGLPKLNGFEVARHIRKDEDLKHTLLVAQTGWGQEHDRQRTKEAGFDHHLVKPADIGELREILAEPLPHEHG